MKEEEQLSRLSIQCLFLRMQLKSNQSVSGNFKTFSTPWLNHNGRGTVIFHHLTVLSPAADGLICIFHFSFSPYSRTSSPSSSRALSSWSAWWWRGGELTYCGRSSQLSQAGFCMRTLPLITIIFIITIISIRCNCISRLSCTNPTESVTFHSISVSGPSGWSDWFNFNSGGPKFCWWGLSWSQVSIPFKLLSQNFACATWQAPCLPALPLN